MLNYAFIALMYMCTHPSQGTFSSLQILTSNSGRTPGFFEVLLKILRTEGESRFFILHVII